MRLLVQRVKSAQVVVGNETVGRIGAGALVLVGVTHGDTEAQADWLVNKLIHLRMFSDAEDKMNLSLLDVKGSVLAVSQFTLYGDCSEGRRPSFTAAAPPALAERLYEHFMAAAGKSLPVEKGVFGAYMEVSLLNDGPVTFLIESNCK